MDLCFSQKWEISRLIDLCEFCASPTPDDLLLMLVDSRMAIDGGFKKFVLLNNRRKYNNKAVL
jgi:hypothetical protein